MIYLVGWFPNLTRAYDNNGRCPRQKFVFGILQLCTVSVRTVLLNCSQKRLNIVRFSWLFCMK